MLNIVSNEDIFKGKSDLERQILTEIAKEQKYIDLDDKLFYFNEVIKSNCLYYKKKYEESNDEYDLSYLHYKENYKLYLNYLTDVTLSFYERFYKDTEPDEELEKLIEDVDYHLFLTCDKPYGEDLDNYLRFIEELKEENNLSKREISAIYLLLKTNGQIFEDTKIINTIYKTNIHKEYPKLFLKIFKENQEKYLKDNEIPYHKKQLEKMILECNFDYFK